MNARLRNAKTGRVEELRTAAPPLVVLRVWSSGDLSSLAGYRLGHFYSAMSAALEHLGWQLKHVDDPRAPVDVHAGLRETAGPAAFWVKPDGRASAPIADVAALRAAGYDDLALVLAVLRARYDAPLELTAADLDACRTDAVRLNGTLTWLRGHRGGGAPNVQALAGYRKRLRDALIRDLDLPEALAALWDGLRPGALSPASQLSFLKEASAALALPLV